MSQILESRLSDEDFQLAGKYHLGNPLKVYRASRRSQRSAYIWDLFGAIMFISLSILGIIALIVLFPAWFLSFRLGLCLAFVLFAVGVIGLAKLPSILSKLMMTLAMVFLVVTVALVVLAEIFSFPGWFSPIPLLISYICMSFMAGISFFAARHDGQETRLVVCEAGLLTVRKVHWYHRVQVIFWKDIHFQQVPFRREEWRIIHRGLEPLGVLASGISASDYQGGDELFASIRERIAEAMT